MRSWGSRADTAVIDEPSVEGANPRTLSVLPLPPGPAQRNAELVAKAHALMVAMFLAMVGGHSIASAHPDPQHESSAAGEGLGVEVLSGPAGLAEFLSAFQWAGTPTITDDDNLEGELAYVPGGCTPLSYADADVGGKIALVDQAASNEANPCPPSTFFQKVQYAQQAGAIGFLQVPTLQANSNATAINADIPALDLVRVTEVDEDGNEVAVPDDATALRDAVKDGQTVVVNFTDRRIVYPSVSNRPCEDGFARGTPFRCDGVDLLGFVSHKEFDSAGISDLWGWTDGDSGDEYVIMGKTNGVAFFRVTDPTQVEYLGELPNPSLDPVVWHDIKVHADHAFIVSESEGHGMTVFDLTRLRDVQHGDREGAPWDRDARYPLTTAAHNLEINEEIGMAYILGGNGGIVAPDQCLSGLHMVDINEPKSPRFAGCYVLDGGPGTAARTVAGQLDGDSPEAADAVVEHSPAAYVHDARCVVYDGPDEEHLGQHICVTAAENKIVVADVTNPLAPMTLGTSAYDHVAYAHQGWFDESQSYWFVNDELAQMTYPGEAPNTRTIVMDLRDLDDPKPHLDYFPPNPLSEQEGMKAITHNNYVVGDHLYQSNYASGLRVADIRGVAEGQMSEVAWFDTYPTDDATNFDGTWSNYPFFESGTIAVSGRNEGLFLLRLAEQASAPSVELTCDMCALEVRSGESETASLTAHNTGDVEDSYDVTIDGVPAGWTATAAPDPVALAAGDTAAVEVTIEVPRQERGGTHTLTVTVTSQSDPDVSASSDVVVDVVKGKPSNPGKPGPDAEGPRSDAATSGSEAGDPDAQAGNSEAERGGGEVVMATATNAGAATGPAGSASGPWVALLLLATALVASAAVRRLVTR